VAVLKVVARTVGQKFAARIVLGQQTQLVVELIV